MSDNKPEPVVEECDREKRRELEMYCECTCKICRDAIDVHLAAHRTAALARREAEIVGMIMEYANIANEEYVYDDLRKLCAMIQGKPLPKSTAEIVQEQIGKSMDRPDAFPSIE